MGGAAVNPDMQVVKVIFHDILVLSVNSGKTWGENVALQGPRTLTVALKSEEIEEIDRVRKEEPFTVVLRRP